MPIPNRNDAWTLLCEYTQSDSLRKHALALEACVRAYAKKLGEDEQVWALTGLLHDFDYERWPNAAHHPTEEHPYAGSHILRERGYPEEMIHAILGHAHYCNVERVSPLDRALFACDELSGFLTACALVKPSKSIHEVEAASVKKKLKDKAFARGVSRDDVYNGATELGVPLDEHISFCIEAMRSVADSLGLAGAAPAASA
jgi:putative nucleotidyltransferase with HDIG domain